MTINTIEIRIFYAIVDSYDNAVMESFYHTLKVELIYTMKLMTEQQASNAIFDYIASFYNRQRRHSTLNYLSPMAYEAAA